MTTDATVQLAILADALTEIVDIATAQPNSFASSADLLTRVGASPRERLWSTPPTGGRFECARKRAGWTKFQPGSAIPRLPTGFS